MSTERIMVVEDERLFALDIRNELNALGYRHVDTAHSAEVALSLYEDCRPDLVLLDIKIDGPMDGIELGQIFLERGKTPIVYMTAFADAGTIARAKLTLPYGYIVKPIQRRELHSVVETALYRFRSERERSEAASRERLLELQLLANQKMDAIEKLSAGIAHELNNALFVVAGNIDLASSADRLPVEVQQHLCLAKKGCERSAELIRALLGFASLGSYNPEQLPLAKNLQDILSVLTPELEGKLEFKFARDGAEFFVRFDRRQLREVVSKIVINAQEAINDRGMVEFQLRREHVEAPEVFNRAASSGGYVCLEIKDSGCGVSQENLGRIFEPFFTTKPVGSNIGLGLTVVYGIMQRHGGWVSVQSEEGRGTIVSLYFPEVSSVETEMLPTNGSRSQIASGGSNGNVLLIDDEEMIVDLLSKQLNMRQLTTVCFTDPDAAVSWHDSHAEDVDVVVLDMKMPGLSGPECFHAMQRVNPSVKIVLFSGYAQDQSVERLLQSGAKGFYQKPFDFRALIDRVTELAAEPRPAGFWQLKDS